MSLNSINTNIAAFFAQSNIGKASSMASSSIARLSSGDRIVRAADDVAAVSAGTSLRTNVTTLRTALINTSQGSSLLQVADGALSQVTDILQRQKAIAVQASSGSITDTERGFLDQEFQNLSAEIDRLVDNTNFNGVTLLDGSLSENVDIGANDSAASNSSISITFTDLAGGLIAGESVTINGVTIDVVANAAAVANNLDVVVGANTTETLNNIADQLNGFDRNDIDAALTEANFLAITQATYSVSGNSLVISARNGGAQGDTLTVTSSASGLLGGTTSIEGTVNGQGGTSVFNLLSANNIAAANITDSVTQTTGNATTTEQFETGNLTLTITSGAGNAAAVTANVANLAAGDSLQDIVNEVNSNSATTGISARIIGTSGNYNIQFELDRLTGEGSYAAADTFTVTFASANALGAGLSSISSDSFITGTLTNNTANVLQNFNFYAVGGDDTGIGAGDTVGVGTTGDAILTGQNQTQSEVQIVFGDIADDQLVNTLTATPETIIISTLGANTTGTDEITFSFTSNTAEAKAATEINVGDTLEETLDNAVTAINSYFGTSLQEYSLNQVEAFRDGNNVVIRSVDVGTTTTLDGTNTIIVGGSLTTAGLASITNNGNLNNGNTDGVTTSGVTNSAFVGNIITDSQRFVADFDNTADTVTLSLQVGDSTYSATNVPTNVAADSTVRLVSEDGDYFDIELQGNQGLSVSSQADADIFAQRLNAAVGALEFYQSRTVSSYTGDSAVQLGNGTVIGSLIGTEVSFQSSNFTNLTIEDISVTAASGSSENGIISLTIEGETYTSLRPLGDTLGANQTYRFTSASDENQFLEFTTGDSTIEFDTDEKAAALENALKAAFGVGDGSSDLSFQVGVTSQDTLSVAINSITTETIYDRQALTVGTQADAAIASEAIDAAIDAVTSVRADVGALQSRFDFAAANVESSIQNQDAARGILLDTDVATESTAFATAQVQLQAGIAVLAQANLLPQNLLKLIG